MARRKRRGRAGKERLAHWKKQSRRKADSRIIDELSDPLASLPASMRSVPVKRGVGFMSSMGLPDVAEDDQLNLPFVVVDRDETGENPADERAERRAGAATRRSGGKPASGSSASRRKDRPATTDPGRENRAASGTRQMSQSEKLRQAEKALTFTTATTKSAAAKSAAAKSDGSGLSSSADTRNIHRGKSKARTEAADPASGGDAASEHALTACMKDRRSRSSRDPDEQGFCLRRFVLTVSATAAVGIGLLLVAKAIMG